MAYRYEETQMLEEVKIEKHESAHLRSIRELAARIKELTQKSEMAAQSSYFKALRALNYANNAKAILGK
ncbi:MAG: hypothetical protein J7501_14590 [Bdellovibrio sp.]|nr:hypothetical protein [Bdellovibrio sp.]